MEIVKALIQVRQKRILQCIATGQQQPTTASSAKVNPNAVRSVAVATPPDGGT